MNKKLTVTKVALIIIACCAFLFAAAGFAVTALASEKNVSAIKIEIDYGNYDGRDLPKGKAGKSYPVFACTAFDNDGGAAEEIRITVKNSEGQTVPQKGGRFETASVGKYTIEYTAISGYVTATETITVEVESYVDTLKYDEEGENVPSSAKTGSVVLADFGTFSGGVGDLTIETILTFGKTETALSETETGVYFIPETCGSYTLSYVATDFVGDEKAVVKSIEIEDSAAPVVGKPSVPASAIGGETIEFPLPDGVLYKNGKKYYLPVTVYFDGEELGADMKAENLAVGEHTVKYVCENPSVKDAKTEYDYKLTVKGKGAEEGERIFDDYFDFVNCEPVTCDNKEYGVRVGKADVASFAFSRKIPVDYLNFDISTDSGVSAYSSVYFVMTDSENADDCVKVRIKKLSSYNSLYLSYDDETRTIINLADGGVLAEIKNYADGRVFEGFKSGKAYISFEINGVKRAAEFSLRKIASNVITTDSTDYASPAFLSDNDFRAVYVSYIGHSVYLPELRAFDLLDSDVKITLKVTGDDGVIYQGNGGYTLEITKSGEYLAEYFATDTFGNRKQQICTIYVGDFVSPVIKVADIKGTVAVGEEIELPEAEITDNDTAVRRITSYVYVLKGNNRKQLAGSTYTFTEAGEYIIRYVAYDKNQNYTIVEFKVICK